MTKKTQTPTKPSKPVTNEVQLSDLSAKDLVELTVRWRFGDTRQDGNIDRIGARMKTSLGCGGQSRARGHHVIDQQDITPVNPLFPRLWHPECSDQIAEPRIAGLAVLIARRPLAVQRIRAMLQPR